MLSTVTCTNCGNTISAANLKPGDWTDCNKCLAKIIVPGAVPAKTVAEARTVRHLSILSSTGTGRTVIYFLLATAAIDGFSTILSLMVLSAPAAFESLMDVGILVWIAGLLVSLTATVFLIIWAYRVHVDLTAIWNDYPISPKQAAKRVGIPIYNLFMGWTVVKTLTDKLATEGPEQEKRGKKLQTLLGAAALLAVSTRFIYGLEPETTDTVEDFNLVWTVEALGSFVWAVFSVLWIWFVKVTAEALSVYLKFSSLGRTHWTQEQPERTMVG